MRRTRASRGTRAQVTGVRANGSGDRGLRIRRALVALTGYDAPSDVSAARAAGFDEHRIKPAELARLERILATLVPGGIS